MVRTTKLDKDRLTAVTLTVLGGAGLLLAMLRHWNALEMGTGIEGSLAVTILAPMLALSSGAGYRATVMMTLPILLIQYAACVAVGGPALPVVSLGLGCLGFLGFVVALAEPAPAEPARLRARRPSRGAVHTGATPLHH